jgi:hypothetical protein
VQWRRRVSSTVALCLEQRASSSVSPSTHRRVACPLTFTMESLHYPHFDAQHSQVSIALFRNVTNAGAVKARIIAAATAEGEAGDAEREAVNFAFIDARLVR